MSKLLIITDHRFYQFGDNIYDNYVFDYEFFKEYREVFDDITVLARVKKLSDSNPSLVKSNGPNVNFICMPDLRGLKWLVHSKKVVKDLIPQLLGFDAYCFRIPSIASYRVSQIIGDKPSIFELIGDPSDSLKNVGDSFLKQISNLILGKVFNFQTKKIINRCISGSYVSFKHLQEKFPIAEGNFSFIISSIRLPKDQIISSPKEVTSPMKSIKIIHVGSFVPVKNQLFLIEIVESLNNFGVDSSLQFVGDGALRRNCEEIVRRKGLNEKVIFSGHLTGRDNITQELDKNDIFILPSSSEGMPRSLIEAMSRGLICFGSKRGGTAELLEKEFLFELNNPDIVAKQIIASLSDLKLVNEAIKKNLNQVLMFEQSNLSLKRKQLLSVLKNNIK